MLAAMRTVMVLGLLIICSVDHNTPPRHLLLIPIGVVSDETVLRLRSGLTAGLRREVVLAKGLPVPATAYEPERKQYLGDALLAELEKRDFRGADRLIGVIDGDAYAPNLNFIFGQARNPGRFALVALPRLRQSLREKHEDVDRFHKRVLKVAIHEIGHTLGMRHCEDRRCVMHFANSVVELDESSPNYCTRER